jgi:hypothetical protein
VNRLRCSKCCPPLLLHASLLFRKDPLTLISIASVTDLPYVSKNFWSSRSVKNVINCRNNFVRKMLSMRMIFTPEQQIFMIEPYLSNGHTLHTFRESDSVQLKCSTPSSYWGKYWDCQSVKRGRRTPIISQATVAADWLYQCQFVKGLFERILKNQ